MPASHVLVNHAGTWYTARLLHLYRLEGRWRAVIRYSVAPGATYQLAEWADDLRPVVEDEPSEASEGRSPGR